MREGWVETTLGNVADWSAGGTPASTNASFYSDGTIPWAVIADVRNCPIAETARQLTEDGLAAIGGAKKIAPAGSVLLTMYGSVGRSAIARIPMATNQAIAWAVPDENKISSEYLFYFLRSQEGQFDALARGATQRNINKGFVTGFPISVPPLVEQQRIVDLIGSLDEAIEAAEGMNGSARSFAVESRKHFFESVSRDWVPAGDVFDVTAGKQLQSSNMTGNVTPYIRAGNIADGKFNLNEIKTMFLTAPESEKLVLKRGDVLVVEGGNGYGKSAVWNNDSAGPMAFQNHVIRIRSILGSHPTELAHQWARWCHEQDKFKPTGTGIPNIGLGKMRSMSIPSDVSSPPDRASMFALLALDATVVSGTEYAASLRALRTNLFTALLSGDHEIPASYDDLLPEAV